MWYKTAEPFIKSGQLAILGVVQEQHAERAQLYKQWKQYDFPIVQDATTQLNLAVVPIPVLIDEHGIVRNNRARPDRLDQFITKSYESPPEQTVVSSNAEVDKLIRKGNKALNSTAVDKATAAIDAFKQAVALEPDSGKAKFSLGAAYRMRFDSPNAQQKDFENASRYWSEALATNPNQYIWRRRIEQYGPRQGKPYPFYDWVDDAIEEIKKRGDTPVKLNVGLTGTEIAKPSRKFSISEAAFKNPDPESKIFLDEDGLVELNAVTVPSSVKRGETVRVHLQLTPKKGKWNNEAGPMLVWIDDGNSGTPEKQLIELASDEKSPSAQSKTIDFEFKTTGNSGESGESEKSTVAGYVLFHICDDEGVCFYHRKNFSVDIATRE